MYVALGHIMETQMPQIELYSEIGKAVCRRTEKGAAVAAAAYLSEHYPGAKGFSPRNIRRMRDFYCTYENQPALLSLAMKIGWTQNVVILEANLSMEQREWYLKAAAQFVWSKAALIEKIVNNAHATVVLAIGEEMYDTREKQGISRKEKIGIFYCIKEKMQCLITKVIFRTKTRRKNKQRWRFISYSIFAVRRLPFIRC